MHFWSKIPFFRLFFPFALGIVPGIYINQPIPATEWVLLTLLLLLVVLYFARPLYAKFKFRYVFGLAVFVFMLFGGYSITVKNTEKHNQNHFSKIYKKGEWVLAQVTEATVEKAKSFKLEIEIQKIKKQNKWFKSSGHALIYLQKDSAAKKIDYGDIILLNPLLEEVSEPKNPNEFNYKRYLYYHNIYHQSYVPSGNWFATGENNGYSIYLAAHQLRKHLLSVLKSQGFSNNEFAVASALVLGYKDELDKGLVRAYSSAGATHVLAVSGLHVGIIYLIINFLLKFLEKNRNTRLLKTIIIIGILWFYALLTGLSPSVMRASVMFTFVALGTATGRFTNIYNTLAASAFALLLWKPYLLVEVGFQLSYLAVLGIVFIQPKLYNLWTAPNWLLDKIWGITAVSIAAQMATFPLGLLYFHQFPNYFLFSNLVVIPMAMLILCFGLAVFVFSPIPFICALFAKCLWGLVWFLNAAVNFIEQLPLSITEGISISIIETYGIYLFIALFLAFVTQVAIKYLRYSLVVLCLLLGWNVIESYFQVKQQKMVVYNMRNDLAIDFINGKQHYFLSSQELVHDEDKMLFHVKHNWWENGLNHASFIHFNQQKASTNWLMKKGNFIQFLNQSIVIIGKEFKPKMTKDIIQVDYIILSNGTKAKLEELKKLFDFNEIIIASNNPWWMKEQWLKVAKENSIPIHSIEEQGAFVVEF